MSPELKKPQKDLKSQILVSLLSFTTVLFFTTTVITVLTLFNIEGPAQAILQTTTGYSKDQITRSEVLNLIKSQYPGDIPSEEQLAKGELNGLVEALDDPYSEYLIKQEQDDFQDSLNQRYVGIGVRFDDTSGEVVIDRVFRDSPADKVGLKVGDILIKVENESITENSLDEIANMIRGEEGTSVNLTFLRGKETFDVESSRAKIVTDLVYLDKYEDVAVIEIASFGEDVGEKVRDKAQEILADPEIKALVLDLRGNSGGLLNESQEVLSTFLPKDSVVMIEESNEGSKELKTVDSFEPLLVDYPIIVAINGGSASASEIVAGALRDKRGAKLVGEKTFGKGVVQKIYDLNNGDQLKLTVSEWFTPNKNKINKEGIAPDLEVTDYPQILDKSIEEARLLSLN